MGKDQRAEACVYFGHMSNLFLSIFCMAKFLDNSGSEYRERKYLIQPKSLGKLHITLRVFLLSAQSCQNLCCLHTLAVSQGETSAKELGMAMLRGWACALKDFFDGTMSLFLVTCLTFYEETRTHYKNTPIQMYWKFYHQKMAIFQIKNFDIFHISAQNIDCGYSLEPPQT